MLPFPAELLTQIFIHLADGYRYLKNSQSDIAQPFLWLRVVQVCRYWHDVVSRCSQLWSFIDTSYPVDIVQLCIARSGNCPLVVKPIHHRFSGEGQDRAVLELVLKEIHRVKTLEIHLTTSLAKALSLQYSDPLPAPILHSLCLCNVSPIQHNSGESRVVPFHLDCPKLTSLTLFHFDYDASVSIFQPSIVKLAIDPVEYPSLDTLRSELRNMPSLVALDLRSVNYFQSYEDNPPDEETRTELHRLCSLHVEGSPDIADLFSYLKLPIGISVSIDITTEDDATQVEEISEIIADAIKQCGFASAGDDRDSSPLQRFHSMHLKQTAPRACGTLIEIWAWPSIIPPDTDMDRMHVEAALHLHLKFDFLYSSSEIDVLSNVCKLLNICELQTLILEIDLEGWTSNWTDVGSILASANKVQTIIVPQSDAERLAALISNPDSVVPIQPADASSPSTDPDIPFAGLQTLCVWRLQRTSNLLRKKLYPLPLSTALKYRTNNGVGLRQLIVQECLDVDHEDLELALAAVPEAFCNGMGS